jgi:heme-degrading monooxygenase HmoA
MKHMRVATYEITKGTFDEVADKARDGLLPKFQESPGFIRYGVADVGDMTLMSFSLWESREQAGAASSVAETWVRETLADRIKLQQNWVGDIAFLVDAKDPVKV